MSGGSGQRVQGACENTNTHEYPPYYIIVELSYFRECKIRLIRKVKGQIIALITGVFMIPIINCNNIASHNRMFIQPKNI